MIVAAVSYLNTIPFIWGIQQATLELRDGEVLDLILDVPAKCAELCKNQIADVALIPIAAIPYIENCTIITDFCLSAEGAVDTVALLTNCDKLDDIQIIYLDDHSRTSVELIKILASKKWNITPTWVIGLPDKLGNNEAMLAIGDKVFAIEDQFTFKLDLALEWQQMTGLPFVFAVWVACTEKGVKFQHVLNAALGLGVDNIDKAIQTFAAGNPHAQKYLTENIKYPLSSRKQESMRLFWEYLNPG